MRTREKEELCLQPKTGNGKPRRTSSSKPNQKMRQSQKVYLGVKVKTVREKLAEKRCKSTTQPVKLSQSWKKHIEHATSKQRRHQEKESVQLTPLRNVTPLAAHHQHYHDTCRISQTLPFYGGTTTTQVSSHMMMAPTGGGGIVDNSLENIGNIFKSANYVTTDNKWLSTLDMDDSALKFKTFNASSFTGGRSSDGQQVAQTSSSSSSVSVVVDSCWHHHGGGNVMTMMMEGGGVVDHHGQVEKWVNYHQFNMTSSLDHHHVVTSHQSLYNPSSVLMMVDDI